MTAAVLTPDSQVATIAPERGESQELHLIELVERLEDSTEFQAKTSAEEAKGLLKANEGDLVLVKGGHGRSMICFLASLAAAKYLQAQFQATKVGEYYFLSLMTTNIEKVIDQLAQLLQEIGFALCDHTDFHNKCASF